MSAALIVRSIDRTSDGPTLRKINTSVTSEYVFEATVTGSTLLLQPHHLDRPCQKTFAIDLDDPPWEEGFVAIESGKTCGFIAISYAAWNKRLTIWHFYVDLECRGRGIGRLLMNRAIEAGQAKGAATLWAETSNRNFPGVEAYRRLGFSLSGLDLSLYRGTASEGEFALFLARPLDGTP